jgi:DNA-binding GntR family transcriptional regulator
MYVSPIAASGRIRHNSLTEQIANAVKMAIFDGELQPGQRLVEQAIAKQHNVGQNAVREALISLAHQGFVKRVANRATFVTRLSLEEAEQLSVVRAALEGAAVEMVRVRYAAGEVSLEELENQLNGMREAAERLDRDAFYRFDMKFHRELWQLAGNPFLEQTLEQTAMPLFAFFIIQYFRKNDKLETLREAIPAHEEVISCIRSGNSQAAQVALNKLVEVSVKHQQGLVVLP